MPRKFAVTGLQLHKHGFKRPGGKTIVNLNMDVYLLDKRQARRLQKIIGPLCIVNMEDGYYKHRRIVHRLANGKFKYRNAL